MRLHGLFNNGPEIFGHFEGEWVVSAKTENSKPPLRPGGEESKPSRNMGDALRQAYDDTLQEEIPDDLLNLLKQLD